MLAPATRNIRLAKQMLLLLTLAPCRQQRSKTLLISYDRCDGCGRMSEPRTFLDGRVALHAEDCREVLRRMADNSVDSVVTDPPYHLTSIVKRFGSENANQVKSNMDTPIDKPFAGQNAMQFKRLSTGFMGKQWDGGDIAFQTDLWAEVLRVLKPGGYIMAFSGCRTYHRMACAIEDAGFITHPMFAWVFGSGFPKAHNLSKQLDKMAGAEREVVGKSNRHVSGKLNQRTEGLCGSSTFAETIGMGAYESVPFTDAAREWDGWFYGTQSLKPAIEPVYFGQKPFERGLNGAQNVVKWGVGAINVGACRVGIDGGTLRSHQEPYGPDGRADQGGAQNWRTGHNVVELNDGRWPANLIHDGSDEVLACFPETVPFSKQVIDHPPGNNSLSKGCDSPYVSQRNADNGGSAASFFYTAKADADDRLGSKHPTVKPLDLIQYLVRLTTPKNGLCLDLFAGTGTTGEACFREGFRAILIEREAEYIGDIERRMSLVMSGPVTRAHSGMKARGRLRDDGPLFFYPLPYSSS